jgi:hypothetical protein
MRLLPIKDMRWFGLACLVAATACGEPRLAPALVCPAGAHPAITGPEAGFIDVAASSDVTVRHFYAFQPADQDPESKPLVLFFNGGPTVSSFLLLGSHTGRVTLDPNLDGSRVLGPNASSWTRFANLLWVEPRWAGFSYDVHTTTRPPPPDPNDPRPNLPSYDALSDARAFLLVLLRFFDAHPALRCSRVMLAGESYGGVRASLMLGMLYGSRGDAGDALTQALVAHFAQVLPGTTSLPDIATMRRQFSHQLLIQPLVAGQAQHQATDRMRRERPTPLGPKPIQLGTTAITEVAQSVADLGQLLGVDPRTIPRLLPAERGLAAHPSFEADEPLQQTLGALHPDDHYFTFFGVNLDVPDTAIRFADNLRYVETLITDAAWDMIIDSRAIAPALVTVPSVADALIEGEGSERRTTVRYVDGTRRAFRLPRYEGSDHTVSASEPEALLADAIRFFEN